MGPAITNLRLFLCGLSAEEDKTRVVKMHVGVSAMARSKKEKTKNARPAGSESASLI